MTIEQLLTAIIEELKILNSNFDNPSKELVKNGKRFLTVKQWGSHHSWPSEGGLRNIIFHKEKFVAEKCFKKVGRRILIDEEEFLKWIESNPESVCEYLNSKNYKMGK